MSTTIITLTSTGNSHTASVKFGNVTLTADPADSRAEALNRIRTWIEATPEEHFAAQPDPEPQPGPWRHGGIGRLAEEAAVKGIVLEFDYRKYAPERGLDAPERRLVEPYERALDRNTFGGHDRARKDFRSFRYDRVVQARLRPDLS
jgi:hypothetical protein